MTNQPLLSYWYTALSSPYGVELTTNNAETAKAKLYAARREARDPDLETLALVTSPFDPSRVWIVKKRLADATP